MQRWLFGVTAIGLSICATISVHATPNAAPGATAALPQANPPLGWQQFCRDNSEECTGVDRRPAIITLDERLWRRIVTINADVNAQIEPVTDQDHWGMPEKWSYPEDGRGDCEDYVLEKRRRLIKAGFPVQALLITVVRDRRGDGHAVLTIRTDRGDFVLDNQAGTIRDWRDTGYRFVKRQSEINPTRWVSLGGIDSGTVAAGRR